MSYWIADHGSLAANIIVALCVTLAVVVLAYTKKAREHKREFILRCALSEFSLRMMHKSKGMAVTFEQFLEDLAEPLARDDTELEIFLTQYWLENIQGTPQQFLFGSIEEFGGGRIRYRT